MRIGEWVPVYKQWLPIPARMGMAFGLQEGSELYLARITDTDTPSRHACEMIVSPVPVHSWRSACRLSIRLNDYPKALATATRFLRQKRINILLTECCTTYQNRAHWDAICDLTETEGFDSLRETARVGYERHMASFLDALSLKFIAFAEEPENRFAFLGGADQHILFSPLTGLNDAHFICDTQNVAALAHHGGAVALPDEVVRDISYQFRIPSESLPDYAIVTGNTEQRYIRVLFMRDYDQMFQVKIENDLLDFAGGGVGVLHQILDALPPDVNLVRAANYIVTKNEASERGRIELIGHWHLPSVPTRAKAAHMENELRRALEATPLVDVDGKEHQGALRLVEFASPRAVYPRVYVSFASHHPDSKLQYLLGALSANLFEPVLGSELRSENMGVFRAISGCVAFISLQVRRDDYKVTNSATGDVRYVLPPWVVAEEVFAVSKHTPLIMRLRDSAVEEARYGPSLVTKSFSSSDDYEAAVSEVINELQTFRRSREFVNAMADGRARQFDASRGEDY